MTRHGASQQDDVTRAVRYSLSSDTSAEGRFLVQSRISYTDQTNKSTMKEQKTPLPLHHMYTLAQSF
jgi:hypothetical protein